MSSPLAITPAVLPTNCPHCRCKNVEWNETSTHYSIGEQTFCGCYCKAVHEFAADQHVLYILPYFR